MQIVLDVKNHADLNFLLDLLGRLQIAEVLSPKKRQASNGAATDLAKPIAAQPVETDVLEAKTAWNFDRFYGIAASGMTSEAIDEKFNELRQEWERDI